MPPTSNSKSATNAAKAFPTLRAASATLDAYTKNTGSASQQCKPVLSPFASLGVPSISVSQYCLHLASRLDHGDAGILRGLILLCRLWKIHSAPPTPATIHRLLLACVALAMKAHYDDFYVTKYMARIGGVDAKELTTLEMRAFLALNGSANVRPEELQVLINNKLMPLGQEYLRDPLTGASVARRLTTLISEDIRPTRILPSACPTMRDEVPQLAVFVTSTDSASAMESSSSRHANSHNTSNLAVSAVNVPASGVHGRRPSASGTSMVDVSAMCNRSVSGAGQSATSTVSQSTLTAHTNTSGQSLFVQSTSNAGASVTTSAGLSTASLPAGAGMTAARARPAQTVVE